MRALILPDRAFLSRERHLLARLEVGLADDGFRVLHALPASMNTVEFSAVYSTPITYADTGLPFTRSLRADAFVRSLLALAPPDPGERLLDVIHCFGDQAVTTGSSIARAIARISAAPPEDLASPLAGDVLLAVEVWRRGQARVLARAAASAKPLAHVLAFAADPALMDECASAFGPQHVRLAPWGVHIPESPRDPWTSDRSLCCTLAASGRDPAAIEAVIRGVSRVRQAGVDVLLFVDADLARTVPILRWAGRGSGIGDVRGAISLIADLESQRELVLQTHLLLAPESSGEQRSIMLEAMAAGVPVLAGPDDSSSAIVNGTTAMVIPRSTGEAWAESWASAIIGFMRSPGSWSALSRSAREAIRQDRLASASIACVLDGYRAGIARLAEVQSGSTSI